VAFPKLGLIRALPVGHEADPNVMLLASQKTERFVPINTATTFTLGNAPLVDHTLIYKNGSLMDDGAGTPAYSIAGKVVTLNVAANGTDVFQVRYFFRVS
jgi:hypothetical protein